MIQVGDRVRIDQAMRVRSFGGKSYLRRRLDAHPMLVWVVERIERREGRGRQATLVTAEPCADFRHGLLADVLGLVRA